MLFVVHSSSESICGMRMLLMGTYKPNIRVGLFDIKRDRANAEHVAEVDFLLLWREIIGLTWLIIFDPIHSFIARTPTFET